MGAMTPVPKDHPLMLAWETYKATADYTNTRFHLETKFAGDFRPLASEAIDGALWAAFERGWRAGDQSEASPEALEL